MSRYENIAYFLINKAINIVITSSIVIMFLLGGYCFYMQERQLDQAGAGYLGYTMEELGAVGWMTIDHTNINYPIMQGKDNAEYLNKNPLGQFSLSGSIFLDASASPDFTDPYSVIYGHHMDKGKMFGALDDYKDFHYLKSHAKGKLKTRKTTLKLQIITCIEADGTDQNIFDGSSHHNTASILQVIDANKKNGVMPFDRSDRIITLATCNDVKSTKRIIVFASIH